MGASKKILIIYVSIIFILIISVIVYVVHLASGDQAINNTNNLQQNTQNNLDSIPNNMQKNNNADIPLAQSNYKVTLKTEVGDIVVELTKETPKTTGNFVKLAQSGFYNNTIFHRTIEGFMIQGGDPEGNGTGGPGYKFEDEPFLGEYTRGTIAMANSGPNTNGSQFFIMHADVTLPPNYTIFGKVVSGIEVVDKIATAPVRANPFSGEASTPINPVKIISTITEEMLS
jgi:cyclophilin family peptidyl-prolyl cis-trans isomerase